MKPRFNCRIWCDVIVNSIDYGNIVGNVVGILRNMKGLERGVRDGTQTSLTSGRPGREIGIGILIGHMYVKRSKE